MLYWLQRKIIFYCHCLLFFSFRSNMLQRFFQSLISDCVRVKVISSLHLSMCLIWKTVIRQTSTNSAHCSFTVDVLDSLQLSLCCPSLTSETFSLDHPPRLNKLWQPFLGIRFPSPQFMWCLASFPKSARESAFSDFLHTWDRHYFTVPQPSEWSRRTCELLRSTADLLYNERTENRNAASKPLSIWHQCHKPIVLC